MKSLRTIVYKLMPSNKLMFVITGLLMIFLGGYQIYDTKRIEDVLKSNIKVQVQVEKISKSRKDSNIYFIFDNKLQYIILSNKAIKRNNIKVADEIELLHLTKYPDLFIYKNKPTTLFYYLGSFLLIMGIIATVRGILKSNLELLNIRK